MKNEMNPTTAANTTLKNIAMDVKNDMIRNLNKVASLIDWTNQNWSAYIDMQVQLIKIIDNLVKDITDGSLKRELTSECRMSLYKSFVLIAEEDGKKVTSNFFERIHMEYYVRTMFIEVLELVVIEFKNEIANY